MVMVPVVIGKIELMHSNQARTKWIISSNGKSDSLVQNFDWLSQIQIDDSMSIQIKAEESKL